MPHRFCTICGAPLREGAEACLGCGRPVPGAAPAPQAPAEEEIHNPMPDAIDVEFTQADRLADEANAYTIDFGEAPHAPPPPQWEQPRRQDYTPPRPSAAPTGDIPPPPGSPYEPITTWGFVGILLLMLIPVVNLVLLIVWTCGGCRKIQKRAFARAGLLIMVISMFLFSAGMSLFIYVAEPMIVDIAKEAIEYQTGIDIGSDVRTFRDLHRAVAPYGYGYDYSYRSYNYFPFGASGHFAADFPIALPSVG